MRRNRFRAAPEGLMAENSLITCSGSTAFKTKVVASNDALETGSFAQTSQERSGGMLSCPLRFANKSLDSSHKSLLLASRSLSRVILENSFWAPRNPAVHLSRAAGRSDVSMDSFCCRSRSRHLLLIHGCLYCFFRASFIEMNMFALYTMKFDRFSAASPAVASVQIVFQQKFRVKLQKSIPFRFAKVKAFAGTER